MTSPLETMRGLIGTRETTDNSTIVAWANAIGQAFPEMADYAHLMHDATTQSWCGFCMGYVMAINGIRPPYDPGEDTKSFMWAQSWRGFGTAVDYAQPGDVLVYQKSDGSGRHVTMCDGEDGNYYVGLGGNQSDQVKRSNYLKGSEVAIRRPPAPSMGAVKPAPIPLSTGRKFTGITATVFADATVAYSDVKPGWNDRPGVSLPAPVSSPRPQIRVWRNGRSVDCPIIDKGPWNTDDPYWLSGARPQAESGTDRRGRKTNLAGIDLTPAAAAAIGLDGKGLVDWEIIQESPVPEPTPTPTPQPTPAQPAPQMQLDLPTLFVHLIQIVHLIQNPEIMRKVAAFITLMLGDSLPASASAPPALPPPTAPILVPAPTAPAQPPKVLPLLLQAAGGIPGLGVWGGLAGMLGQVLANQAGLIGAPVGTGQTTAGLVTSLTSVAGIIGGLFSKMGQITQKK